MSRDPISIEPEIDRGAERSRAIGRSGGTREAGRNFHPLAPEDNRQRPEADDSVRAYYLRDRTYLLPESQFATLVDIGRFRVVDARDLAQFGYWGDHRRTNRDVRHLVRQELVLERALESYGRKADRFLVLSKRAKRLLEQSGRLPDGQAVYDGLARPREARHDAALYRLYQSESARIENAGGRPLRVVLDYELTRNLHRQLAQLGDQGHSREARERVAGNQGLVLVNDTVQVPDLRLEYETADFERTHVDLEFATRNYRPCALVQKARAGFSIYLPREDASKLRRIFEQSELPARIFAL